jgi:hypothetical protein
MGTILAVIGIVVAALGLLYALYRDHEPGDLHRSAIAAIRRWRRRSFEQSLAFARRFVDSCCHDAEHNESGADEAHRRPECDDLFRWAMNSLLTAAARIHPASQGKANLFSVQSVEAAPTGAVQSANLRSLSFVGPFPLAQLRESDGTFRDMPVANGGSLSVAGQAYRVNSILLEVVARQRYRSDEEKRLGTTHILAIPIGYGLSTAHEGSLAVLAVDLRIPRRYSWLYRDERTRWSRRLRARAEKVQELARALAAAVGDPAHA